MLGFLTQPPSIKGEENSEMIISSGDDTSHPLVQKSLLDIAKQDFVPRKSMEDRISSACHNVTNATLKGIDPSLRLNKKGGEKKPSYGSTPTGQTMNQEIVLCDAP